MSKYKFTNSLPFVFFLLAVVAFVFYARNANATYKPPKTEIEQEQDQSQKQHQGQEQGQQQNQSSHSDASSAANNEGNSLSVESNYEGSPAEVVLIPHNNTANCQRVYGLGGGNSSGNVVLGFPFRDKTCDLEAAADDAFAQGNLALGWVFKCKQKNLRKAFGGEDECLQAVGDQDVLNYMKERVTHLENQKKTLMHERQADHERCTLEKDRILEGCLRK